MPLPTSLDQQGCALRFRICGRSRRVGSFAAQVQTSGHASSVPLMLRLAMPLRFHLLTIYDIRPAPRHKRLRADASAKFAQLRSRSRRESFFKSKTQKGERSRSRATNFSYSILAEDRARGVVAFSSGCAAWIPTRARCHLGARRIRVRSSVAGGDRHGVRPALSPTALRMIRRREPPLLSRESSR